MHVIFERRQSALLRVLHHLLDGLLLLIFGRARRLRRKCCLLRGRVLILLSFLSVFSWPVGQQPVQLKHVIESFLLELRVSFLQRLLTALHVRHLSLLLLLVDLLEVLANRVNNIHFERLREPSILAVCLVGHGRYGRAWAASDLGSAGPSEGSRLRPHR